MLGSGALNTLEGHPRTADSAALPADILGLPYSRYRRRSLNASSCHPLLPQHVYNFMVALTLCCMVTFSGLSYDLVI